ncbi:MAG: hypothetical protein ACK5PQ_00060 [Alphaproteobacteria bacterium]
MNTIRVYAKSTNISDKNTWENIKEEIRDALDLDASRYDERATVDFVNIISVLVESNLIHIEYNFQYSAYYGCRDRDITDISDNDSVTGTIIGDYVEFDTWISQEMERPYDYDDL